ncbi:MAG: hypothetical protein I8H71_01225 [Xanthomonadaceae bacterium]|nr:hypothetical protein [Xanthomonadaceae bacterium]
MPRKSPSPAENATKAKKPSAKPTPKKPAAKKAVAPKKTPQPKPEPAKRGGWRAAQTDPKPQANPAPEEAKPLEPGKGLIELEPAREAEPLTPWEEFKHRMPHSFEEFIGFIASGGHLAAFCKEKGIAYTTILTWITADAPRSEMYARAREDRADVLADEIVAIADEVEVVAKMQGDEVRLGIDAAAVSRNKLRVDARKWAASKLKPRTYGDKIEFNGTVNHRDVTDGDLLSRLSALGVPMKSVMPEGDEGGGGA